jgi:hypothetical protein
MKTHDLTLHVGEGKHLKDGWEHTTSESGTLYRYKYTPTAYVHQEVGDRVTINIALDSNVLDDYAIESVSFPTDPRSQLFLADQEVQEAYCVVVVKRGNERIACDPMIGNDPKGSNA